MKKTSEVGNARLEIFTAVKNQVVVLWIMTPCSDVVIIPSFCGSMLSISRVKKISGQLLP